MYAGGDTQFFISEDAGETWQRRGLEGRSTLAIWVDPQDPKRVLAGTTDGLYLSEDAGENWTGPMLERKTVTAITRDAAGTFCVGTAYDGVWAGNANQKGFTNHRLPGESIVALHLSGHGELVALTKRGLWKLEGR